MTTDGGRSIEGVGRPDPIPSAVGLVQRVVQRDEMVLQPEDGGLRAIRQFRGPEPSLRGPT
jgi:hypothetical protein